MSKTGSRSWDSCKSKVWPGICIGGWSYHGSTSGGLWSGNNYYKCTSGYSHNPLVPFNHTGICYKYHAAVNIAATRRGAFQFCSGGEFDGFDGSCYACPTGYAHNPILPHNTSGVCVLSEQTTATAHGAISFICQSGEFLDVASGQCSKCPTGYNHNPVLPANVPGVCFTQDNQTASLVGDSQFICPAGSFYDLVTNACYTCADGYMWNPTVGVNDPGVCFKLQVGTGSGNANFQVGMQTDWDVALRWGVKGGITMDSGSVAIDYKPAVSVQAIPQPRNPGDPEVFTLRARQMANQSVLDMTTTWPSVVMEFDSYIAGHAQLGARLVYPKPDLIAGGTVQVDEYKTILNSSTHGEKTLAADPIARFRIALDGMQLDILGAPVANFTGGFDPPIEITRPVVQDPESGLSLGMVVVEAGLTTPDMNTPARSAPPYNGTHGERVVLTGGADGTYIRNYITPAPRTNFSVLNIASGAQDMDVGRFDVDLDGFYALMTDQPLGIVVSQSIPPLPIPKLYKINGSIFDLDAGVILGFKEDFNFRPNLSVTYAFSKPVMFEVVAGSGQYQSLNSVRVKVGSDHKIIHPGGDLMITTTYDVIDNQFTNDTDLVASPIMEGEVLSLQMKALGVSVIPKASVLTYTGDLWPEPVFLTDVNFYNSEPKAVFGLDGFSGQTGGMLVVTGSNQPPVALCKDAVVHLDGTGSGSVVVGDIDGGSYDPDVGDSVSLASSSTAFSCADVGKNVVSLIATDSFGLQSSCSATVTVVDNTPPTLTIGADQLTEATSIDGASIVISAQGQDNCGVAGVARTPDISVFPLGKTSVTWTAVDVNNNSTNKVQFVEVVDTTPPVLTVPADVSVEANAVLSTVNIGTATATDIFGATVTNDAPATFPLGTTTVTWTATDTNGNAVTGTQNVMVSDTTAPVLSIPADVSVEANAVLSTVSIGTATATDIFGATVTNDAPATFPLGTTTVTWTATDTNGNVTSGTQNVTVSDTTAPVLTVPADVSVEANGVQSTVAIGNATATDIFVVTVTNNAPAAFPLGTTVVIWTATDANGNVSTATQNVTVVDTTAPVLSIPADVSVEANAVLSMVSIGTATATDIFGATVTNDAPATFPLGTTTVTWTATDTNGNAVTGTQNVTVVDTTAPVLSVPVDVSVEATGVLTTVAIGSATATDIFAFSITSDAPATYPLGTTVVTWTATDVNGNVSTATQNVAVVDTTPPAVVAALVPFSQGDEEDDDPSRNDSDEGRFAVQFTALDIADPNLAVTAELIINGYATPVAVTLGQVIEFEFEDEKTEVEVEHGVLEIEAPSMVLRVTATDASGNSTVVDARPQGLTQDNDDDYHGTHGKKPGKHEGYDD